MPGSRANSPRRVVGWMLAGLGVILVGYGLYSGVRLLTLVPSQAQPATLAPGSQADLASSFVGASAAGMTAVVLAFSLMLAVIGVLALWGARRMLREADAAAARRRSDG